jgi:hypothetical protein
MEAEEPFKDSISIISTKTSSFHTENEEFSEKNLEIVEKNDFSLMAETHVCLCLGKALFTEIAYDGM